MPVDYGNNTTKQKPPVRARKDKRPYSLERIMARQAERTLTVCETASYRPTYYQNQGQRDTCKEHECGVSKLWIQARSIELPASRPSLWNMLLVILTVRGNKRAEDSLVFGSVEMRSSRNADS